VFVDVLSRYNVLKTKELGHTGGPKKGGTPRNAGVSGNIYEKKALNK
jgi:hypothetical protein